MTTILGILSAVATIVGAILYWSKVIVTDTTKTPEQKKEDVDNSVDNAEEAFRKTGRPQ